MKIAVKLIVALTVLLFLLLVCGVAKKEKVMKSLCIVTCVGFAEAILTAGIVWIIFIW